MRWTILIPLIFVSATTGYGLLSYNNSLEQIVFTAIPSRLPVGQHMEIIQDLRRTKPGIIRETEYILVPPPPPKAKPAKLADVAVQRAASTPQPTVQNKTSVAVQQTAKPTQNSAPPPALPPILFGVVAEEDRAWALLTSEASPLGKWVTLNDEFEGWIVRQIGAKSVLVERQQQRENLHLIVK